MIAPRPQTTLLIEPFGGLAGDMFLSALLDLERESFRLEHLQELAASLVPESLEIVREETRRGSLRASLLRIRTPETEAPPHRHLSDLLALLEASALSHAARARAARVLRRIADAEAEVHGIAVEAVHFHEVGAVDTLIDVCGVVHALECLGIERVRATPPYVGGGTVTCAHGEMPVPAPGTARILLGVPHRTGAGGERLTPTGAALLVELADEIEPGGGFGDGASWATVAIGYGAGQREPREGPPNLVRLSLGHACAEPARAGRAPVWLLECNLDDATPEEVGFLVQELRARGALEAWSASIQMKKDRPGALVSALCRDEGRVLLEGVCFAQSPTLGVRWVRYERTEASRETVEVVLEVGEFRGRVRAKVRLHAGGEAPGPADVFPEYDDLAAAARATGRAMRELDIRVRSLVLDGLPGKAGTPPA